VKKLTRREFILTTGVATTLAAAGCERHDPSKAAVAALASKEREIPRLVPTVCEMCEVRCGLLAYVEGGKLFKLEGNYNHSHSLGRICALGSAAIKLLYDPNRLKYPMKRTAEGKFERISWEQAFYEIAQKLAAIRARFGPQALAWVRKPGLADEWDRQFMRAFGSPNIFSTTSMGRASRDTACRYTLGWVPIFDYANSHYIMLFGRNIAEGMIPCDAKALMDAKAAGAHIVAVDPRLTNTAAQAHEWIPIKPGTDGALLLAMMNVIVNENLYDVGFVNRNILGFDRLKSAVQDYTPWWAASITDVPAETTTRLARQFAAARPACGVDIGWHGAWGGLYGNSVQTARAALALNALVGNYGVKGGMVMPAFPKLGDFRMPPAAFRTVNRVDGAGGPSFPLVSPVDGMVQMLPQLILSEQPYPIKAMIVNHANPAMSLPNAAQTLEALKKLDLLIVIDVQPSETTELAHYILPESTFLERYDPIAVSNRLIPEIALRQPVVEPLYDTRPSHEIISDLGRAMGLGKSFVVTIDQMIQAHLRPSGMSLEEMKTVGVWQSMSEDIYSRCEFRTPSGQIEVYCETFKAAGFDPLPTYDQPIVSCNTHDFRLLTGKDALHTGTSTQNNALLHSLSRENVLWLNPDRAYRLGIRDGDWVWVKSNIGAVRIKIKLTEGLHPEAVFMTHGFGHSTRQQLLAYDAGVHDGLLMADHVEPIGGGAALAENIVTISKAM